MLSASRDSTAILWSRESSVSTFAPDFQVQTGSGWISAIAYIPPTAQDPQGKKNSGCREFSHVLTYTIAYAVTGGQDGIIRIFGLGDAKKEPDFSLIGHSANVCALDISPGGVIISGSWDE